MQKHSTNLALLLLVCLMFTGCKKDAEINSTVADLDSFTNDLIKKIESAPNPLAGIDDAQKYFDSRKDELTAKMTKLKTIRSYQASEETTKKMTTSLVEDAKKVANLQLKYIGLSMRNPAFKTKLDKLTKDYTALFTM